MIPFVSRGNDQLSNQCLCSGPGFPHGLAEHSTVPIAWGWGHSTQSYHSHAIGARRHHPFRALALRKYGIDSRQPATLEWPEAWLMS